MLRERGLAAHRDAFRAAVVATVAAAALVSTLSTLSVFWIPRAGLGVAVSGTSIVGVAPHSTAEKAGIKPGDRLDPAYGFADRARILWYDDFAPGERVALRTVRDGRARTAHIVAVQHAQPLAPLTAALMALRLLTYVVFILVGAALVLLKPARFSWGFFLCCLGLATMPGLIGRATSVVDASLGFVMYGIWLVIADLANVGFLAFALRFPSDAALGWRRIVWRSLPLWFLMFACVDAWQMFAWYSGADVPGWVQTASWATGIAAWSVSTFSLALTYRDADHRNRKRLWWAIVGASVGYLSWYVDGWLQSAGHGVAGQIVGFGTLALPVSVGYAVLKHRVVDVRFAINRAVVVSVVGSCTIGALALTYWATTALLQQSHLALYVQAAIALLLGLSLHRVYVVIKDAVARLTSGHLRQARNLIARAAAAMSVVESYEALEALLAREAADALDLEFAAVFRRGQNGSFERTLGSGNVTGVPSGFDSDDPLVLLATADRNPLQSRVVRDSGAALALQVHAGSALRALVLFGPHRNGFDIDADEVRAIAVLVQPACEAYRNLDRLAQHVRSLALAVRDWGNGQFLEYLVDQILASLPPDERKVLLACTALPDASDREITLVAELNGAGERAVELARSSPFIERNAAGRYSVQAALRESLRARLAGREQAVLLTCAADAEAIEDHARAAELYFAADSRTHALRSLELLYRTRIVRPENAPHAAHLRMIEATPVDVLVSYPVLLTLLIEHRSPLRDDAGLYEQADQLVRSLDAGNARSTLAAWLMYALSESGDSARAASVLSDVKPVQIGNGASYPGMAQIATGIVLAKRGRLDECSQILGEAPPLSALMRAIHVEHPRGRVMEARALIRSALDHAPKPWSPIFVAGLADQLICEWLSGSEANCVEIAGVLADGEHATGAGAFAHLVQNVCGGSADPPADGHPRHAAYSYMIRTANAPDHASAVLFAYRALERAVAAGEALIEAQVLVCLAELEPATRIERLSSAVGLVAQFESAALHASLAALVGDEDHCGMLEPLVARIRAPRTGHSASLSVRLATGVVRRGSIPLFLAEGELALLVALARAPGPHSTPALLEMLWPDQEQHSALRSLQSCVHRLRTRLGEASAIESVAQGYQLRPDVSVDLWHAERILADLNSGRDSDTFAILQLGALRRAFGSPRPMPIAMWEWFAAVESRIAEVARSSRLRLAEHWLRTGVYERALECARELIAADDLDEAGWELSIRAHLAAGSVSEGQRDFRTYRDLLADELAVDPPQALAALVAVDQDRHPL